MDENVGTLEEIVEEIIRADLDGGIFTDENRTDSDFMEAIVHSYRADAIFKYSQKYKRPNNKWTQQHFPKYDKDLQYDNDRVVFLCPDFITIDEMRDGGYYIGTTCGNHNYSKVVTRADLASRNNHRYMKVRQDVPKVLRSDGMLEIYGDTMLEEVLVDAIWQRPTDLPEFNKYIDPYPITGEILSLMKEMVTKQITSSIAEKPIDTMSDSLSTPASINAK